MEIVSRWWAGDGAERFWLEATNRPDIGTDLKAPLVNAAGVADWRYVLFKETQLGDTVFHYDANRRAIVGVSEVSGEPQQRPIVWAARGSYAKAREAVPTEVPGYFVPLSTYRELPTPLSLDRLQAARDIIDASLEPLKGRGRKQPLYFPFELSDRPIRPLQGYAFKLPAAFVAAFPELSVGEIHEQAGDWSVEETAVCVEQYLELLERQEQRDFPNGAEVTRALAQRLPGRTPGAVGRKMNAISAVVKARTGRQLQRFYGGHEPTPGVAAIIHELLNEMEAISDPIELERRTAQGLARSSMPGREPPPQLGPQVAFETIATTRFKRRASVRIWVLRTAKGLCEACSQPAPFETDTGIPFLEVHHLRPLAEGGPDQSDNALALCPNCHRRLHLAKDRAEFRSNILRRIHRLIDHPAR